jgi:hypothetical protein
MKTVVSFAGYPALEIPKDAADVIFSQRNHGGYLLQYKQTEKRNPGSIILVSEQVRTHETKQFFSQQGELEATCIVTSDWETQKPSVDAEVFGAARR